MIFAGKQQESTMNHIKQAFFTWINNESNRSSIYHAQVGAALLVKSLELGDIAAVLSQCPDPPPEISVPKREGFGGMASIDILRYCGILLGISLGIYGVFIGYLLGPSHAVAIGYISHSQELHDHGMQCQLKTGPCQWQVAHAIAELKLVRHGGAPCNNHSWIN